MKNVFSLCLLSILLFGCSSKVEVESDQTVVTIPDNPLMSGINGIEEEKVKSVHSLTESEIETVLFTYSEYFNETYSNFDYSSDFIFFETDRLNEFSVQKVELTSGMVQEIDIIIELIMTNSAEFTDYGLIFGYASHVLAQDPLELENLEITDIVDYFNVVENSDCADMTFPCYTTIYNSEVGIDILGKLSRNYVEFIIDQYGEVYLWEILSGRIELDTILEIKNEWGTEIGLNRPFTNTIIGFSNVPYTNLMDDYVSIWRTSHATWYLEKDFKDVDSVVVNVESILWPFRYSQLLDQMEIFEQQMDTVDLILNDSSIEYHKLRINLIKPQNYSFGSSTVIDLVTAHSLSHEYIHYIDAHHRVYLRWLMEVRATYYSMVDTDYYHTAMSVAETEIDEVDDLSKLDRAMYDSLNAMKIKYNSEYINDVIASEYLRENFIFDFINLTVYYFDDYSILVDKGSYFYYQWESFANYFILEFGKELFDDASSDEQFLIEETGKNWDEHILDWENFVIEFGDNYLQS